MISRGRECAALMRNRRAGSFHSSFCPDSAQTQRYLSFLLPNTGRTARAGTGTFSRFMRLFLFNYPSMKDNDSVKETSL